MIRKKMQQDLAIKRKDATDKLRKIEREISILDSFVSVATDERLELIDQDKKMKELLDECSDHYKQVSLQVNSCLKLIIALFNLHVYCQL